MKLDYCSIVENKKINEEIYEMTISYPDCEIKPGQFFMIKSLERSYLLPRPISVYDYDGKNIKFLYKIVGKGTELLGRLKINEKIQILGPLGNGFELNEINGKIALVAGGIGIAPLNYLVKKLKSKNIDSYLGFKDIVFCTETFKKCSKDLIITTENGSIGKKGYITDYAKWKAYDTIITCGPEVMMNKVIKKGKENHIKTYASLEKRMACGIGACLGCSVKTKDGIKRACKEGPIFLGEDLIIEEQTW